MLEVLAERGVPAPDAYPKPLTEDVLLAADVVVTMGCGDECPHYPAAATRTGRSRTPRGRT
ncbi:MAG: hypothetical protein ABR500_02065 [Dermatophilaceae bacterium]